MGGLGVSPAAGPQTLTQKGQSRARERGDRILPDVGDLYRHETRTNTNPNTNKSKKQKAKSKKQNLLKTEKEEKVMKSYILVASVALGSMLAGQAQAAFGPIDLPCYHSESDVACYDGYYDPEDLNGQDYYVDDWYQTFDFDGKWVSEDDYYDTYARYDPEEYPESGKWCRLTTDGINIQTVSDAEYEAIYGQACDPDVVVNTNEPPPAGTTVDPADILTGVGNLIDGIGSAIGRVVGGR